MWVILMVELWDFMKSTHGPQLKNQTELIFNDLIDDLNILIRFSPTWNAGAFEGKL